MEEIKYVFEEVAIGNILESEINPQILQGADMDRLVNSIKKDNALTSAVLLMRQSGTEKLRYISGHHRIKAARKAGLKKVPAMIINEVNESTQYRLQLSHNDIHGTPDMQLAAQLAALLDKYDIDLVADYGVEIKEEWVNEVEKTEYRYVSICMMPESADTLAQLIAVTDDSEVEKLIVGKKDYEKLTELLTDAFKRGFKTPGRAFRHFLDLIEKHGNNA